MSTLEVVVQIRNKRFRLRLTPPERSASRPLDNVRDLHKLGER